MLDHTPAVMVGPTAPDTKQAQPAVASREDPSAELGNLAVQEPTSLAALPAEIVLSILGCLDEKRDWLALARAFRRMSSVVVPELDRYDTREGKYYGLWYACVANKPAILLRHIARDAAVVDHHFTKHFWNERGKVRFGRGMTPLSVAVVSGKETIVKLLLVHGADPDRPDCADGPRNTVRRHPIHWAVASKRESSVAVIRMLGAYSANMNQVPKGSNESTPECLIESVSEYPKGVKCAPIFRLLMLEKPPRTPDIKPPTNCEQFNNDLRKLQALRVRQLKELLRNGADPNQRYDWDFVTPVFFLLSSLATYVPSFYFDDRHMLSHEADEQARVVNDIAALFLDTLRDFGADIYALGNTYFYREALAREVSAAYPETPLHAACRLKDRHRPIVDWFLRNGVSINSLGRAKSTPLMAYCGSTFLDMTLFRKFLESGAVVNHADILGRTALHDLCANRLLRPQVREKAVKMLLDKGADPTFVSNEGHVPVEEIDPKGLKTTYEDVATMLEKATKAWNKRVRKLEEQERKNKELLALTPCENQDERSNQWRGDRGGGSQGKRQKENWKDGYVNEKTDHQAGNPVDSRRQNSAIARRGNQENRRGSRGGNRGGSHRGNHGDGSHDAFRKHASNDTPPDRNETVSRDRYYGEARGSRPFGGDWGSRRGGKGSRGCSQRDNRDFEVQTEKPAKPIPK